MSSVSAEAAAAEKSPKATASVVIEESILDRLVVIL
jgi:hypothetical protein